MNSEKYYIPDALKYDIWEDNIVIPEQKEGIFAKFKQWATEKIKKLFSSRN